jgi:hypothetical protein
MTMADDHDATVSSAGFSNRDLIIQANTKLDSLVIPQLSEIRLEQDRQRRDIDELKTARAVDEAEEGAVTQHKQTRWTRAERIAAAVYSAVVALIFLFGPLLVHYLEAH